jgi:3'-phosphoadenosine 5'-phosphosulfate sulfotransferase (PAPS reductase)/FAD synthetase
MTTRSELDDRLNGRRMVVSVSGGKDSAAVCLYLESLGYNQDEYDRVFYDTGWEHPDLYAYLNGELSDRIGPVEKLTADFELSERAEELAREIEDELGHPSPMVRLIFQKMMFPSRTRRYCTENLKIHPAAAYMERYAGACVNVVGIRAEESRARSIMVPWEFTPVFGCDSWRPLLDWTYQDVIEIHQRYNLKPCRLYLEENAERVGCYPCIYARKAELRSIAEFSPDRIDLIERLEEILTDYVSERAAAGGKESPGLRSWFTAPRPEVRENGSRHTEPWPIRRVVQWSRTTRGGHIDQLELFTDPVGHQGCVRWGMCDTGSK